MHKIICWFYRTSLITQTAKKGSKQVKPLVCQVGNSRARFKSSSRKCTRSRLCINLYSHISGASFENTVCRKSEQNATQTFSTPFKLWIVDKWHSIFILKNALCMSWYGNSSFNINFPRLLLLSHRVFSNVSLEFGSWWRRARRSSGADCRLALGDSSPLCQCTVMPSESVIDCHSCLHTPRVSLPSWPGSLLHMCWHGRWLPTEAHTESVMRVYWAFGYCGCVCEICRVRLPRIPFMCGLQHFGWWWLLIE